MSRFPDIDYDLIITCFLRPVCRKCRKHVNQNWFWKLEVTFTSSKDTRTAHNRSLQEDHVPPPNVHDGCAPRSWRSLWLREDQVCAFARRRRHPRCRFRSRRLLAAKRQHDPGSRRRAVRVDHHHVRHGRACDQVPQAAPYRDLVARRRLRCVPRAKVHGMDRSRMSVRVPLAW